MDLTYETRSRSRSKTPGFENGNSATKVVKKTPNVSLIEEEIIEIIDLEPASQTPSQRPKRKGKATKIVTSDYSSDNYSPESAKQSSSQQMSQQMSSKSAVSSSSKTTVTTTTMISSSSSKKTTNGSGESSKKVEQATSTTSASEEILDSKINESHSVFANVFNAIKTSTPILAAKRSQRITSEVSSTVSADHPAYKEYKEAGEYWNKYPKTDYTYSELSPHRRDLGKGNVAMPNMSRKSLDKFQNRVESMIHNNPQQESFLRRRFFANNTSINKYSAQLQYDSQDEVDETLITRKTKRTTTEISENNILSRFFLYIINMFYSCYYSVKNVFYTNVREQNTYGSPRASLLKNQQVGIFARGYGVVKSSVLTAISKMYLVISSVLCFDTWLLRTRSENVEENKNRKRFLLMLLVLFPLLMLGGIYLYLDPPQNMSFPKISFPKIDFPKITFPKLTMPKISLPSFSWPKFNFPTINWPTFTLPSFTMPTFSLPSMPTLSWPTWLTFTMPELSWPTWLTFTLPTFTMPKFSVPSIDVDFSQIKIFFADKFELIRATSVECFDKVCEATHNFMSEAQILWNENFNSNSK